ncbi:hypothetical protein [Fischerella sp. JS2]|nr:hypothetical protein [Fischerella sp. JS2]
MPNESQDDPFFVELCQEYTSSEIAEIEQYLTDWDKASYVSVAHT